jgi:tetratricopeptide (TPR) repeat protein
VEEAIECYRTAIALDPKSAAARSNLGAALHRKGKVDEAIACFRKAIALDPKYAAAQNNLGLALKDKGKVEEAIECFRKAIALDPKYANAHSNLGAALRAQGKVDEAIAYFRKAIALDPRHTNAHGALGQALMQQGQFGDACKALRCCLQLLPPNSPLRAFTSRLLQQSQQALTTEEKLKALLAGKPTPDDPAVLVQMAVLAQQPFKRLYLTSARLYRNAFSRQPSLAAAHRYDAACAAVPAATGQSRDRERLDDTSEAELRYCALSYLQDDLGHYARLLPRLSPVVIQRLRQVLLHWQKDADLAAVRDPDRLRKLPEAEQVAWRNLWAQVEALLARASPRQ